MSGPEGLTAGGAAGPLSWLTSLASRQRIALATFIFMSVLTAVLSILPYTKGNALIGRPDEANVANLALNVAQGKGFVVDSVWLHTDGGLPGTAVTHAEPYWSVYLAALVAPFFKVLGASRVSFILPAILCKILIVGLLVLWVWRITKGALLPTIAAIAMGSMSGLLLRAVGGLSDIHLTAAMLASTSLLAFAFARQSMPLYLGAGLLCGFAIGLKPSGLLLLGLTGVILIVAKQRLRALAHVAVFAAGVVVGIAPYLYYNKVNHGTWAAPGLPLVSKAAGVRFVLQEKAGLPLGEAHNTAFYDPSPVSRDQVSDADRRQMTAENVKSFVKRGLFDGDLLHLWLAPFVIFGVAGVLATLYSKREEVLASPEDMFLLFGTALMLGGTVLALRVHYEVRYWNFLVPVFIVVALAGLRSLPRAFCYIVMALMVMQGAVHYRFFEWKTVSSTYARVRQHLPPGVTVFTANPWHLAFYARIPSVATPFTSDIQVLRSMSARYSADYLVIIDNDSRHDFYRQVQSGLQTEALERVHDEAGLQIFRIRKATDAAARPLR